MKNDALKKVTEQLEKIRKAKEFSDEQDSLLNELDEMYGNQEPGIYPGKMLKWNIADGSAMYYIEKISSKTITLKHVTEYWDGYQYPPFYSGGNFGRRLIEKECMMLDRWVACLNTLSKK